MSRIKWLSWVLVLVALIGVGPEHFLRAQAVTGTILGTVSDASGAVVPGATVTVTDVLTNEIKTRTADDQGNYLFPDLPLGQYRVGAEKSGFKKFVREGIVLNVNQNARVDVVLEVGETTQSVVVRENAPLVDTHDVQLGALVDRERIQDLPLNGRLVYSLVTLLPGVSSAIILDVPASYNNSTINVNGSRVTQGAQFLLDGGNNENSYRNYGNVAPNPDAVEEFQLLTSNYDAQYGHSAGGILNVVVRSGSNKVHGSAYDFLENNALNARSFFTPSITPLRQNQFGGTVGGPLRRDKLFGFFAYQGERVRTTTFVNGALPPTAAQRNGDFSALASSKWPKDPSTGVVFPSGIIPPSLLDPVAQKILKLLIPLPNTPTGTIQGSASATTNYNQYVGKVDYLITPAHRLSAMVFFERANALSPFYSGANIPGYSPNLFIFRQNNAQASETWTIRPTLLNQFLVNYSSEYSANQDLNNLSWPDFGSTFTPVVLPAIVPRITVSGAWSGGDWGQYTPLGQSFEGRDMLTWIHGRHTIKVGTSVLHFLDSDYDNTSGGSGWVTVTGAFTGNANADFLLGRAATFTASNANLIAIWQTNWHSFIQDDWKVARRLTLNLGLRYELTPPWISAYNDLQTFRFGSPLSQLLPKAPPGLLFNGDPGIPRGLVSTPHRNLAPRVGFAFDPLGNGKTALRAGYGIFYADPMSNVWEDMHSQPSYVSVTNYGTPSFVNPFGNFPGGNPFPIPTNVAARGFTLPMNASSMDKNYTTPYFQQYSLMVQQQLASNLSLEVGYVGNVARHLFLLRDLNRPIFIPGQSTASNVNSRRPILPGTYAVIGSAESGDNTSYNSLQVTLNRRFSRGFTVLTNYTYSKTMDTEDADPYNWTNVNYQNGNNRREDWGPANFDYRHIFNLSLLWQLPSPQRFGLAGRQILGGWQANAVGRLLSGYPFTVTSGSDINVDGVNTDRPNELGDPRLSTGRTRSQLLARYFNPAVFQNAAPGMDGTAGRDILYGPGSMTWNMSFFKNIKIHENHQLQFRAEFFNIFNKPNFGNPVSTLNSAIDGEILSASGGRVIQGALHYSF